MRKKIAVTFYPFEKEAGGYFSAVGSVPQLRSGMHLPIFFFPSHLGGSILLYAGCYAVFFGLTQCGLSPER